VITDPEVPNFVGSGLQKDSNSELEHPMKRDFLAKIVLSSP